MRFPMDLKGFGARALYGVSATARRQRDNLQAERGRLQAEVEFLAETARRQQGDLQAQADALAGEVQALMGRKAALERELAEIAAARAEAERLLSAADLAAFDVDEFPGAPRILFIGSASSTHTHSWVELLRGRPYNLRMFSPFVEDPEPPETFHVRTYTCNQRQIRHGRYRRSIVVDASRPSEPVLSRSLADVIGTWRPDVIHTLGFFHAGRFYAEVRRDHGIGGIGRWLLQFRGGSDLELNRFRPELVRQVVDAANQADQILSDNTKNFDYLAEWGVDERRFSRVGTVPGTGGIDIDEIATLRAPEEGRRDIVWPKTYNTAYTLALPVIEGIKLAWDRIKPCTIHMLWTVQEDVREWLRALPPEILQSCRIEGKVEREEVLRRLGQARVMLAPSMVDGTPNTMFEAMALGALPIVSPLETVKPVVRHEENVLFARNLYPQEIADALVRSMTDDATYSRIVRANHAFVHEVAGRRLVRSKVLKLYDALSSRDQIVHIDESR